MRRFIKAGFACFIFIGQLTYAQSIYSFQGLGSLNHQGMPSNAGVGEIGIAYATSWHVNTQNPANLVFNNFSSFQLGVQGEGINFSGDSISGSDFDAGLRSIVYAFPIKPGKWSSSFGILPFSSVNYNTFTMGPVDGDPSVQQTIDERGEGGLTHFFWSNGVAVNKNFYLGVRANYTFGSIDQESTIDLDGSNVPITQIRFVNSTSYSDLNLLFGATYRKQFQENTFLNFGLIYSFETNFSGENSRVLERIDGRGVVLENDELSNVPSDFKLPQTIGLGIAYQKTNLYVIGVDFETQAWENSSTASEVFQNQLKVALGGEWTPDFDNVNSYFQRATYRIGFNYEKIPYVVNNQSINDFGINFGASLPVSGFSSIDLAFKFGQLGTTSNGLVRESYYRIVIGATINDRWFIKRRID